jgi:hypothetical protein
MIRYILCEQTFHEDYCKGITDICFFKSDLPLKQFKKWCELKNLDATFENTSKKFVEENNLRQLVSVTKDELPKTYEIIKNL